MAAVRARVEGTVVAVRELARLGAPGAGVGVQRAVDAVAAAAGWLGALAACSAPGARVEDFHRSM